MRLPFQAPLTVTGLAILIGLAVQGATADVTGAQIRPDCARDAAVVLPVPGAVTL